MKNRHVFGKTPRHGGLLKQSYSTSNKRVEFPSL